MLQMVRVQWKKLTDLPRCANGLQRGKRFVAFYKSYSVSWICRRNTTSSTEMKKIQVKLSRKDKSQQRTRFPIWSCGRFPNGKYRELPVITIPCKLRWALSKWLSKHRAKKYSVCLVGISWSKLVWSATMLPWETNFLNLGLQGLLALMNKPD